MLVNNTTFNLELAGLLPFMSYNCCVSTIYGSYTARRVCTEIVTIHPPTSQPGEIPTMQPSGSPIVMPEDIDISTTMAKPGTNVTQPRGVKPEAQGISTLKPNESPTIHGSFALVSMKFKEIVPEL
jgi:hypothetical protein